jgi:hypothetical protein
MVTDQLFSRVCFAEWVDFGSPAGRPDLAGATA